MIGSGLEPLEGRLLQTAGLTGSANLAAAAQVAPASTAPAVPSLTLFELVNDPYLASVLYNHPTRMASQISSDGAVGVNASWEAGTSSAWYIEEQRYGADFVQAGLAVGNSSLVQQGWHILDWGFAHEEADGSFPGTGDPFHSTSMFLEGAARSLLLEVQSGASNAPQLVAKYLPEIDATAHWLMDPKVAATGASEDAPYTHRRYILAAALGEVGELTGEPAEASAAASYAEQGLALQQSNGINPERGGGDASYQMYGILMAERYDTTCTSPAIRAQVQGMITLGLSWEMQQVQSTGQVTIVGDTRTGVDLSRSGTVKTIDYKTIVQAFDLAATITGDPEYLQEAQLIGTYLGWVKPTS